MIYVLYTENKKTEEIAVFDRQINEDPNPARRRSSGHMELADLMVNTR